MNAMRTIFGGAAGLSQAFLLHSNRKIDRLFLMSLFLYCLRMIRKFGYTYETSRLTYFMLFFSNCPDR